MRLQREALLEGGPRDQHWVWLPHPLPDVLVEDTGEYVRMGDSGAYAWVGTGDLGKGYTAQGYGEYCAEHDDEMQDHQHVEHSEDVEHIRPAPAPTRTHVPTQDGGVQGE